VAPEICVEVWSPSNTPEELEMKRRLYFDKGALEFWVCNEQGEISFFGHQGSLSQSRLCPGFPAEINGGA